MTDPERQSAPEAREVPWLTATLLAIAALAWTAGMLISARVKITSWADAAMEVTSTAYALPGAVSAAIVAGAAVALLALTLISGRRELGATARFAVGTGSGLLVGVLCALPVITINTAGTIYAAVGGTVAAAATIGGALAGFRLPPVIAAAGWATLGVFAVGAVLNQSDIQSTILELLGSGRDTESAANANQYFSYGQSALGGLAAGLITFAILRRARRRAGGQDLRWTFYLIAGAGAGVLSVIAEILTRTAGAQVLELAGKVSELERSVQQILSTNRLNSALIVLFVGAFTAMVAVGRTLSPADDDEDETAEATAAAGEIAGTATTTDKIAKTASATGDAKAQTASGTGEIAEAGAGTAGTAEAKAGAAEIAGATAATD